MTCYNTQHSENNEKARQKHPTSKKFLGVIVALPYIDPTCTLVFSSDGDQLPRGPASIDFVELGRLSLRHHVQGQVASRDRPSHGQRPRREEKGSRGQQDLQVHLSQVRKNIHPRLLEEMRPAVRPMGSRKLF